MMKIHCLQHVPFETAANIEQWAQQNGHALSVTRFYLNETLPALNEFDWLIVLGGPMNIYEETIYSWIPSEKKMIKSAIEANKIVIGICLGAQFIADVLGGTVTRNRCKEIGWYPVFKTADADRSLLMQSLPDTFTAFHWHGDTFSIPPGAIRIAESRGCQNQAFEYNGRVFGLQFHVESSKQSIERLIENCKDEITAGEYIQSEREMLSQPFFHEEINQTMTSMLDAIARSCV